MATTLNQSLLPAGFVAEARVQLGGQVEIDVGTFAEDAAECTSGTGGVALWAPPLPAATAPLDFRDPDVFEVQVIDEHEGPRLVAAIELVSPANKDRPANRRMFAVKCASYLYAFRSASWGIEQSGHAFGGEQDVARTPPAFLAHAVDDKAVPPEHSQLFYQALVAQKIPAQYLELPSGGHGLNGYQGPMWDAWQEQSLAWLAQRRS
jgi:hypothetical protein